MASLPFCAIDLSDHRFCADWCTDCILTASATLWQQKQIKQLTQEMSEYQTELQKKIEEAKEEQQREFRNERAELEAAYQAELQAKTAQISQLKAPEEQNSIAQTKLQLF